VGILVGDQQMQPVVNDREAEALPAGRLRQEQDHLVVRERRGHAVRLVHCVNEDEVRLFLRLPSDPRDEPPVHILGDPRGALRQVFASLVVMDQEM
jgi:hypothetical protein